MVSPSPFPHASVVSGGAGFQRASSTAMKEPSSALPVRRSRVLPPTCAKESAPADATTPIEELRRRVEAIVDLTATGTTLRENGLVIREEIATSTARLIANRVSLRVKAAAIDSLVERLRG